MSTHARSAAAPTLSTPPEIRNIVGPPYDEVAGAYPTVDLHLADVPNGAFAQAQVELRAQSSGWLLSTIIACWINSVILSALTVSRWGEEDGSPEVSVTLLVVFVSFASAVLVQHDAHPMLDRLLGYAKALAGLSTVAALVGAVIIAFLDQYDHWLVGPTIASVASALILTCAGLASRERTRSGVSPWDFTNPAAPEERPASDVGLRRRLGFDQPAIVVATSESVRTRSRWSDDVEVLLAERLDSALRRIEYRPQATPGTGCSAGSPTPTSTQGAEPMA
jgi:hypothetical protein